MKETMAMDANKTNEDLREERREQWRGHVDRQGPSGKTVRAYCAEHGLKPWQFWYWRKALAPKEAEGGFVQLASGPAVGVTLIIGGCRLGIERGFDPALLREVVAALRAE
jgi:hypothetical protein